MPVLWQFKLIISIEFKPTHRNDMKKGIDKENQFWNWFKVNEAKYFFLNQIDDNDEKERLLDDFLFHLQEYCDHLFFEIGGYPDEKQDLIITAAGDSDFFGHVESLVKHAPHLEYWHVIAFKPAVGSSTIEYKDIRLTSNTLYFMPLSNSASHQIGLRIYLDIYDPAKEKDFLTAAYLMLDNLLGEKVNALEIGHVEMAQLLSNSEKEELIALEKLQKYINWNKSNFNNT